MIDISIVIPTFNRLWALPKAVDSCLSTDCAVEVIVIDDGSADGTWEWLQGRKDITFPRFRRLAQPVGKRRPIEDRA
ncbi:MAG: glycosyltransferase [Alphaproteobacteria bacterium]|nr:glycosyltransferase [Alphaproteobacteria bacterium]